MAYDQQLADAQRELEAAREAVAAKLARDRLRDEFAMVALRVIAPDYRGDATLDKRDYVALTDDAYELADCMLAARTKG